MTVQSITDRAFRTGVLTSEQVRCLDTMIWTHLPTSELTALDALVDALESGAVIEED